MRKRNSNKRLEQIGERVQMTFYEIFQMANDNLTIIGVITIILMSLVEVSKIKINPWSWLGRFIFKGIIEELKANKNEISELKKGFEDYKKDRCFKDVTAARRRILRFNDEAIMGIKHSQEHFDEVIADIDDYESFCRENPDYKNNKGKMAIQNIINIYQKCINDNSFV